MCICKVSVPKGILAWQTGEDKLDSSLTRIKNLSVNNIYFSGIFLNTMMAAARWFRAMKLRSSFSYRTSSLRKRLNQAMRDLDHPSSGLFVRVIYKLNGLLSAPSDVRDVALLLNDAQSRRSSVPSVGA